MLGWLLWYFGVEVYVFVWGEWRVVRCGINMVSKSKVKPRVIARTGGMLSGVTSGCKRDFGCASVLVNNYSVSTANIPLASRTVTATLSSSTILVNSVNNGATASP